MFIFAADRVNKTFIGAPDHLSVLLFSRLIRYWVRTLQHESSRIYMSINSQLKTYSQRADNKDIWFCYEINEKLDRRQRFTSLHHWPTGFVRNRQFSALYLVLISIVGCILALVALFLNKNKIYFRKYPVFNSPFTLNSKIRN